MLFSEQPGNVLLVFPNETIYGAIDATQRGMKIVLCLATCAVIAARWRAASPPRRRALLPSVAGAACLLMFVWLLGTDLVEGPRSQLMIVVAYSLDARRAGGVPRRPAALAARARRARAALPRAGRDARRGAAGRARAHARRPDARAGLPAAGLARATPTPPAGRCWSRRSRRDRASVPIERDGREVAALVYDASLDDDPEMVEAVRAAATMALENERLLAESEARLAEVQASRQRIVAAGDAERRRLERDLHDGAQQRLVALALQLRMIRSDIRQRPRPGRAAARPPRATSSRTRWRSCASWRAASIRPRSITAWRPRSSRSRRVRTVATAVTLRRARARAARGRARGVLRGLRGAGQRRQVRARRPRRRCACRARVARHRDRDRRRRRGRRGRRERLGPARPRRPRRGADGQLLVTSPPGAGTVVTAELPCGS